MATKCLILAAGLAALAMGLSAAPAAAQQSTAEYRTVAGKLNDIDLMIAHRWWERAAEGCAVVDSMVKDFKVTDAGQLARLAEARKAIAKGAPPDAELRRKDDLIQRVRKVYSDFPERPPIIWVSPDAGDAATLREALARGDNKHIIALRTGVHVLDAGDGQGRNRPRVLYGAVGEWPRIIAPPDADFTAERRMFFDGVELLPGSRGVTGGNAGANLANCYVRGTAPPKKDAAAPVGLASDAASASDCVFENFAVALAPAAGATVKGNLFVTCAVGIRAGKDGLTIDRCGFYRCQAGVAGGKATASNCLFARCGKPAAAGADLDRKDCLDQDDPFRDPFEGDLRPWQGLTRPGAMAHGTVGPDWTDARWAMFMANYGRPADASPIGLGQLREADAARAIAAVKAAIARQDYASAADQLAPLLGRKFANCPAVRKATAELNGLADTVLNALIVGGSTTQPEDGNRRLAMEQLSQARAAMAASQPDEAIALVRKAAQTDPQFLDAQQTAAEMLLARGRPMQAEQFIAQAAALIDADPRKVSADARGRQNQLVAGKARTDAVREAWARLKSEWAGKYSDLAPNPGLVSALLALRRARELDRGNKDYSARLVVHESLLQAAPPPGAPTNVERARELRQQADTQLKANHYDDAIRSWEAAYRLDPMPEDLLGQARSNKLLLQPNPASALAVQARQMASSIENPARKTAVLVGVQEVLKVVDPGMNRLDAMDRDFANVLKDRRRAAEIAGDNDTADDIAAMLDRMARPDVLQSKAKGK